MLAVTEQALEHDGNLIFMPSLFQETMDTILESYDYFEAHESLNSEHIPPFLQNVYSSEMSRVTMRLTSVMAWLLARKSVAAGQMTEEEARKNYRLEGADHCLEHNHDLGNILPFYMNDLLIRSHAIYMRVWRLDQQTYDDGQQSLAMVM